MNFKMNMVICAMILTIAQCGYAVYNWEWVNGKPVPCDRSGVMALLRGAQALPIEHYGVLMAMLVNLPKEDRRDFLGGAVWPTLASTTSGKDSRPKSSKPCPPIAHYGDLTARLLGVPKVDKRDISFEPSRPVTAPVYRKKESLPFVSGARPHCIIVNGMVCHRVDKMQEETQRASQTPKKSLR